MRTRSIILVALLACGPAAQARLAISANDGKQLQKGEDTPVTPDSVNVIDLGAYPPKVIGKVNAPASMIGPPEAVVVARDDSFAIVTDAQKINPADPMHPADNDQVSVIDLSNPRAPRVLQTTAAGPGASGVAMNKAQNLVLVAAKMDGAIHVFRLAGKTLTHVGRVELGQGAQPTDVVFSPDGRHAYAVVQGVNKVMELAVDGTKVAVTGQDFATGKAPYGASITPDGNWLINTNVGGALTGNDRTGTLTMVDLRAHHVALSLPVGKTPEHVFLSPDGKYAAVVLANGTANVKSDPSYDKLLGLIKVFAVGAGTLQQVAEADSCHWAQGATFSPDGRLVLQQCAAEREILVYRFDGRSLTQDKAASLKFESRPGSIATATSR
jgi:6-phosphogluconolactonase (cycloisomerase 2 family)